MRLLSRTFGSAKDEQDAPNEMTPEAAEKIIQDYGVARRTSAPAPDCVTDARTLPYSKERIKKAFILALRVTKDPQMLEQLKLAYLSLADWQVGVGKQALGIGLSDEDLSADPVELAKQIMRQGIAVEKWIPVIRAEQEALESELRHLGLW